MKKYLLLLVVAMLANIGRAAVGDTFEYDGLNYTILSEEDRTVEVNKGYPTGDLFLPAQVVYNGVSYTVTAVAKSAFVYSDLTSVIIPNSVTSIGDNAFGSSRLVAINVEPGNKYFSSSDGVLYNFDKTKLIECPTKKTEVSIPKTVTTIGRAALQNCIYMTSVMIPNTVTSIEDEAFCFCTGLTSLTIPNSVTSIGERAFFLCKGMTSVSIPNSVTSIGDHAFHECRSLKSVSIPNSVTSIGAWVFCECESLITVTIPNSVTSIGDGAFSGCESLTSITIPNSVSDIGKGAFGWCSNLAKVVNLNPVPQELGSSVFKYIPDDAVLYVPRGSVEAYKAAEGWSEFSDIRAIPAK